ncbi:MAG: GH3 auxin-responsive promoter family protein [Crocinitomicaceae bacterium]
MAGLNPLNSIFSWLIKKRIHQIDLFKKHPVEVQGDVFRDLIEKGKNTKWGETHNFEAIKKYEDFAAQVPLTDYPTMKPYVDRMLEGEQNLLWPSEIYWFAKSSGTTTGKSKFLPVSEEAIEDCHYKGGKDLLSLYYNQFPDSKLYGGKHLAMGGSVDVTGGAKKLHTADLSAIIVENMPWWAEFRRAPRKDIALMSNWEEKIEKLAQTTMDEDIRIIAGVPSWTLVLCNRILEISGKSNLREVWPDLELFIHGGVSFEPYKEQFKKLIPFDDMHYVETYNASEGFFGIQDDQKKSDLLLMLDYGIFFEFILMDEFKGTKSEKVIPINEVEVGVNYAVVITTNAGFWRYVLGDTIRFTSKKPYRFKVSGRTKSFINACGEELVVENADKAIARAAQLTMVKVSDYTAAPKFMDGKEAGAHEWIIEFEKPPADLDEFVKTLDTALKDENTDYEAKRSADLSLKMPIVHIAREHLFDDWLKKHNKLGGQHKIPRLNNNRDLLEELLEMMA